MSDNFLYIIYDHYPCNDDFYADYQIVYRIFQTKDEALTEMFNFLNDSKRSIYISCFEHYYTIEKYKIDTVGNKNPEPEIIYDSQNDSINEELQVIKK